MKDKDGSSKKKISLRPKNDWESEVDKVPIESRNIWKYPEIKSEHLQR